MLIRHYETYSPDLIQSLVFDNKDDCVAFEEALKDLLEKDWKKEWKEATGLIYTQGGYFGTSIDLLADNNYISKFNDEVSPMISNVLYLSENSVEFIGETDSVDSNNTYYPVFCFLRFKYNESKR